MEKDIPLLLRSINADKLTAIIQKSLGRASVQVQEWQKTQLGGNAGNPVSAGLYRFAGSGQDGDEKINWSVVLKIMQSPANIGWENMGEGDDQSHWNYWKRELLIYQSGLLQKLPDGLTAPHCYEAAELPGNIALLWLEDIHDSYPDGWPLECYTLTARHLGRLNGMHLSELPAVSFLSRNRTRQWASGMPHQHTLPWDHPRVLKRYPKTDQNSFRRMIAESQKFLEKLDTLPQTVFHGDTYPTNFMSRGLVDGQELTVGLDWALMGLGPLGDDLGQLVYGAQNNLPATHPREITEMLFESYLAGLRDAGCRFDPQQVRFGFAASGALRVGLFQVYLLGESLKQSDKLPEDKGGHATGADCFEVNMANEAYRLLDLI